MSARSNPAVTAYSLCTGLPAFISPFISTCIHLAIHLNLHLSLPAFISAFICTCIHLGIHLYLHSSLPAFISPIHLYLHSFLPAFISPIHLYLDSSRHSSLPAFISPFICTCIHLYLHSSRPFISTCIHLYLHSPLPAFISPSLQSKHRANKDEKEFFKSSGAGSQVCQDSRGEQAFSGTSGVRRNQRTLTVQQAFLEIPQALQFDSRHRPVSSHCRSSRLRTAKRRFARRPFRAE